MNYSHKTLSTLAALLCVLVALPCCGENERFRKPETHLCGAYSDQREVTENDLKLFDSVMGNVQGGKEYHPLSVATQVVAGLNYRFRCSREGTEIIYIITIYQPLQGNPVLSSIEIS